MTPADDLQPLQFDTAVAAIATALWMTAVPVQTCARCSWG